MFQRNHRQSGSDTASNRRRDQWNIIDCSLWWNSNGVWSSFKPKGYSVNLTCHIVFFRQNPHFMLRFQVEFVYNRKPFSCSNSDRVSRFVRLANHTNISAKLMALSVVYAPSSLVRVIYISLWWSVVLRWSTTYVHFYVHFPRREQRHITFRNPALIIRKIWQ